MKRYSKTAAARDHGCRFAFVISFSFEACVCCRPCRQCTCCRAGSEERRGMPRYIRSEDEFALFLLGGQALGFFFSCEFIKFFDFFVCHVLSSFSLTILLSQKSFLRRINPTVSFIISIYCTAVYIQSTGKSVKWARQKASGTLITQV